ncbi:MAG TPA: ABC transporter permease [Candidatus Acidoferrum sp.]|jgi:predicted permease
MSTNLFRNFRRFLNRLTNSASRAVDTDREARLREEIAEHIALQTQDNLRAGLDPIEARRQAMLKFGGVESMKEDYRDERAFPWFEHLLHDIRFALRMLYKNPGFTVVAVVTLALGIGANAAIFSVVRGVLLRPLVNRDEARLLYLCQSAPDSSDVNFSVPEIDDLTAHLKSIQAIGTLSPLDFTVVGLGDARTLTAGVVDGTYFDVVGLHPVLGRLIGPGDDGPKAPGVAVLTYKFWSTTLHSDPSVIGKTIRLGSFNGTRSATVIGVLQPSVPYPVETEIIANIVTSPHHLSATMVTGRMHRMTEVFARLAPSATLESARAELGTTYAAMRSAHSEDYKAEKGYRFTVTRIHDQINSRANTVLWVLLAASGLLFLIACSNVANLFLARTVRREPELALRAALGASTGALRRSLLAEAIVLCGAGLLAGIVIAAPMVGVLSRYASRFSVRAADLALDSSMLWIGVALAFVATIFLAFIPRLPSNNSQAFAVSSSGSRVTLGSRRRLRLFAVTQIAACFLLLAGAGALLRTLFVLENSQPPFDTARVLAINLPVMTDGRTPEQITTFYRDVRRRVASLPGVEKVSGAMIVPWRDALSFNLQMQFAIDGAPKDDGKDDPRARFRFISPEYFSTMGIPFLEGRDFNDNDRPGSEDVVIITEALAKQLFPGQDALNHKLHWTDPLLKFSGMNPGPRRIVGIVPDFDDTGIVPEPSMTIYQPSDQEGFSGRLFVRAKGDPYALIPVLTSEIHHMSDNQPVERASTLDDVRAEIMAPDRLNAIVFGGFATLALLISIVGVAGVLAFSVSGRIHEFGIRLALGASPRNILSGVLSEGFVIALIGVTVGTAAGFALVRVIAKYTAELQIPGATPLIAAAGVILAAALVASAIPAIRAASVDAARALRSE